MQLIQGDATDPQSLEAVMRNAPDVIHLAHGGGQNWPDIERAMVGGAEIAGQTALANSVRRFIFVSSIASLYLGDPNIRITSSTGSDPFPEKRSDYSRGKILAECKLLDMATQTGLPLTIVRPGVVIGEGTSPFHSGVGLFNRETHCLGWNAGRNPLPLVLVDDVAAALVAMLELPPGGTHSYNLVGDICWNARDYIARLGGALGRPLQYHPQSQFLQNTVELAKWGIKRIGGRKDAAAMSGYDLRSRGLVSRFDTTAEKRDLNWDPETDETTFTRAAFGS